MVVADETHARPARQCVVDDGVEFGGGGLPGFVDHDQCGGVDGVEPDSRGVIGAARLVWVGAGQLDEFGDGVGGGAEFAREHFCRRGRRRQAHDRATAVAPRGRECGGRGGLPGAGRGDGELNPRPGGGHLPDQGALPVVERAPVGVGFQQRQRDVAVLSGAAPGEFGRGENPVLRGQDRGAGIGGLAVAAVDT